MRSQTRCRPCPARRPPVWHRPPRRDDGLALRTLIVIRMGKCQPALGEEENLGAFGQLRRVDLGRRSFVFAGASRDRSHARRRRRRGSPSWRRACGPSSSPSLASSAQITLRRFAAVSFRGRFLMIGWICSIIALFCASTSFRTGRTTSEGLPYQWPSRNLHV